MMRLYDYLPSGNCYKARLLMAQLDIPFERVDTDILSGATKTAAYLAKNPNGKVPVLELEDGTCLAESGAILHYLAEGTPFLPEDRLDRARVLQWMFFEQYSHEPYIAVVRAWLHIKKPDDLSPERLAEKREGGYRALGVMEKHLAERAYFAAEHYTIADIALYAYTHVADEGGFDLGPYPAVRAWLDRVRGQPGHIPITQA